jgi:hypothetical protein
MHKNEQTLEFHKNIEYLSSLNILKTKFDFHKNKNYIYWTYALLSTYISKKKLFQNWILLFECIKKINFTHNHSLLQIKITCNLIFNESWS